MEQSAGMPDADNATDSIKKQVLAENVAKMREGVNAESQNLDIDAFQYERLGVPGQIYASQDLIKNVLLPDFRNGHGTWIQIYRMPVADGGDLEHAKQMFQERLSEQLHKLFGIDPFITRQQGDAVIYEFIYSSRDDWVKEQGHLH
jgi:hypothetical protein